MGIVILGTGSDLPMRQVTNDDIERLSVDFDALRAGSNLHQWVMKRAGVAVRHRIGDGEGTSDMAIRATERALADAGLTPADVDLIVLGTFTSDSRLPASVSFVQRALGCSAKCIQLETACTGFVDSVLVATSLMRAVGYRTAVVVESEAMSAVVDESRFLYQTIFGDGAGAVVLRDIPGSLAGIEAVRTYTDATNCEWTWAPGGGTKHPITADVLASGSQYISLAYREIYDFAVLKMTEVTLELLTGLGLGLDDVDWLIPHQTGANIVGDVLQRLAFPPDRVVTCLDHTGNVSGASVAIALDEARRSGRFHDGDRIVIPVVGSGMAWAALSLRWHDATAAVA